MSGYKSIGNYGIIGNQRSAALVGIDGSIDWCCLPRFDSPSVFAALLDWRKGGRFQIAPVGFYRSAQAYVRHTNVLTTSFSTAMGSAVLTDFMPCGGDRMLRVGDELHRRVQCEAGQIDLQLVFEPRFDYARVSTTVAVHANGAVATGGGRRLVLASSVPLAATGAAETTFRLRAGEEAWFIIRYGQPVPWPVAAYESGPRLAETKAFWAAVAGECPATGRWSDLVVRSFLTLHLMTYEPSGAIVAAPTTSLPEEIGGERNWDYRFSWVRDAAFAVDVLLRQGHVDEAEGFMRWLMDHCAACGELLQPLYGIAPDSSLQEVALDHLEGYRGSQPVRIGNAAAVQLQLDIFGEVLLAAGGYHRHTRTIPDAWWELLVGFVEAVCANWRRPDRGIWEIRGEPRQFVYSKLMAWVALDRGIYLAEAMDKPVDLDRWRAVRSEIRREILERGWSEAKGAFTQHYDTTELDASNLLMPMVGFLPATDPRIQGTIRRTMEELAVDGLVHRYRPERTDDGLTGGEGTFTLCSFWLVGALLVGGRLAEAEALFRRLAGYANHLGLFSEMIDPATGEALGNFPQAFTHIAFIHTARNLDRALDLQGELIGGTRG